MSKIRCLTCDGDMEVVGRLGDLIWFRCQCCGAEQSEEAAGVIGIEPDEGDWNYVD